MPIGGGSNINRGISNIAKNVSAAASRSITDQRQVQQKQVQQQTEKQVQHQKQQTAEAQRPSEGPQKDNVSIAKQHTQTEIFKKQEKQLKKQESTSQQQQTRGSTSTKESRGVFKAWLKGVMQNKSAQQARQATQFAKSSSMSPQTLAKTWLQMDTKTLLGLEKFLQAEFAQFPDNYQVFMKLQMIKMVKDAKRMLEEHKLLTETAMQAEGADGESALIQHAAQSMSALGLAFYFIRKKSKLKKKGKVKKAAGLLSTATQESEELDEKSKMFKTLQQAEEFLKQAEAELRQAILFGGDRQQLEEIMNDIVAVYSAIARMTKQKKNNIKMQEN